MSMHSIRLRTMLVVLETACLASFAQSPTTDTKTLPYFSKPMLLGAHRGGGDVWPENSLEAFVNAAKKWPDIILETDAHLTKDGQVVLLHDETVDRTTNGTGPVSEFTLADLQKLDAGYKFTTDSGQTYPFRGKGVTIATLAEALAATPTMRWLVEFKRQDGIVEPTIAVVREAKAEERVLFASFDPVYMDKARASGVKSPLCFDYANGNAMISSLRNGTWETYQPTAQVLSLDEAMLSRFNLTKDMLQAVRLKGVYLQLHTLNDRQKIIEALELGVDSILSDRPDILAEVIRERAKK